MVNLYEFLTSALDGANALFNRRDEKNPFFAGVEAGLTIR
jgi:hypothetical protein